MNFQFDSLHKFTLLTSDQKKKTAEKLAIKTIELTAMIAKLALHFPKKFHMLCKKNNWKETLKTSIASINKSIFLDKNTLKDLKYVS